MMVRDWLSEGLLPETISKRHESTTLEATDGIIITVSGFINRSRTRENGFPPKVYNHFLLGFPFNWKDYMCSSSDKKSPFQCIQASTSHSGRQGTSHSLEPDLDDLAVTRLQDIFLSTYGESSHYLFAKSPNSVSTPMEIFKSGLNKTPKVSQRVNSYQDLKEQGFQDEGKNDVVKDPLHASQEPKSKTDMEFPISGSRGVCTRSMSKLKNSRNRSKESLMSDSRKRQKHRENNSSCENLGKGTGQKVKSSSNVTSRHDFSIRSDKDVDASTDKSKSRRSSLRLMNRKQNQ
ncbi:uncharacterized protein LOC111014686 isoform X2 [Momordica charantia]|uniref:Uncharacterized protein LOC111014686 isoform X2 n=1 Tax=Momordica charantia TaxID=3673 RepID=A0A6J1CVK7_MOMCH|nr:uncharacterized protein LOC111014686 isoform X2 [Momordica charantia]